MYSWTYNISVVKSRTVKRTGHVLRMEETGNTYRILAGKPEGKQSYGTFRYRWEENIGRDLRIIEWEGVALINLAQNKEKSHTFLNVVMNIRLPLSAAKFLTN